MSGGDLSLWSVPVQAGFAAFCAALLAFCAWLVAQIIRLARQTQGVIQANTEAITRQLSLMQAVLEDTEATRYNVERLRMTMEARPCVGTIHEEKGRPQDHRPPVRAAPRE